MKQSVMNKKQIIKIKNGFFYTTLIIVLWSPFKSNSNKIIFESSVLGIAIMAFILAAVWFIKNEEYKKLNQIEKYNLKLGATVYGIIGLAFLSLWLLGIGVDLKIRFIEAIMIGASILMLLGKKGIN